LAILLAVVFLPVEATAAWEWAGFAVELIFCSKMSNKQER
jgi:hypothetical protein